MIKISTILLFIVFFVYQAGNYISLAYLQFCEKEKIEAHILNTVPEAECEIIQPGLISSSINWIEKDETFMVNGEMYDVCKKKIVNGTVYLYCIKEKKEMEILTDLTLKISSNDFTGKHFTLAFADPCIITDISQDNIIKPVAAKIFTGNSPAAIECIKNIIIPPPRFHVIAC